MNAVVLCGGRGTRLDAAVEKPLYPVDGVPMLERVLGALLESRDAAATPETDGARRDDPIVENVYAAVSPNAPRTREHLVSDEEGDSDRGDGISGGVQVLDTPGDGYVEDLGTILDAVGRPLLTVASDLPLLAPAHVEQIVTASRAGSEDGDRVRSASLRVPASLKRLLGASCDESAVESVDATGDRVQTVPAGINVVGSEPAAADGPVRDGTACDGRAADSVRLVSYDARLAINVNTVADARLAEGLR